MLIRIAFPVLLVLLLSACGGGGGGASPGSSFDPPAHTQDPGDASKLPPVEPDEEGQKVVVLEWSKPTERENGEYLEGDEIGGYEVRYRLPDQDEYESVLIPDGWVERWELPAALSAYEFEIATYDSENLYSDFVSLNGHEQVL